MGNWMKSPLKQEGNKYSYLDELFGLFPLCKVFVEPFAGTGVVGLNARALVKIMNDHNKMIYYFFSVLKTTRGKEELIKAINSEILYQPFLRQKSGLLPDLAKMVLRSRCELYGRGSMRLTGNQFRRLAIEAIEEFDQKCLDECVFVQKDYLDFLGGLSIQSYKDVFVYCDPPYVFERGGHKPNSGFGESNLCAMVDFLLNKDWKFAISCRDNGVEFYKKYNLNIVRLKNVNIGFKSTLGGVQSEFLAMNYKIQPELF